MSISMYSVLDSQYFFNAFLILSPTSKQLNHNRLTIIYLFRDALLTSFINSATSFCAGFVIFSVLGYMAHASGQSIQAVATEGPGLVFIVYPAAIGELNFWYVQNNPHEINYKINNYEILQQQCRAAHSGRSSFLWCYSLSDWTVQYVNNWRRKMQIFNIVKNVFCLLWKKWFSSVVLRQ